MIYLAILRGINVSGQKRILMADLKALFEKKNFKNVRTFIQSGNVIFESSNGNNLEHQLEKMIADKYGFEVPVLVRTAGEMESVVKRNPFMNEKGIDHEKLHVTFLRSAPDQTLSDKIRNERFGTDRFIIDGKEVYLYCPEGYGISKLNNTFFEKKLKVTTTTRNWRTTNELLNIMRS